VCVDAACAICADIEICTTCVDNAHLLQDGGCECDAEFFYNVIEDTCVACHDLCSECLDDTTNTCTACKGEGLLLPDVTICGIECPTEYTDDSNECTGTPGLVDCSEFATKEVVVGLWYDGSTRNADDYDPQAYYKRGKWLDQTILSADIILST
jgi:hypothetical protein